MPHLHVSTRVAGLSRPPVSRLAEGEEVPFAVVEEGAELSGSLTRVIVGHDHHLASHFEAWVLDGFDVTPRRRRSSVTASRSVTSNPICVDAPEGAPEELNK